MSFAILGAWREARQAGLQFVQRSLEELEIRLAVERPLTEDEQSNFGRHILDRLGYPFRLRWTFLPEISLSRSGKFEDFVRDFN